jgi:hypothetical protein
MASTAARDARRRVTGNCQWVASDCAGVLAR